MIIKIIKMNQMQRYFIKSQISNMLKLKAYILDS